MIPIVLFFVLLILCCDLLLHTHNHSLHLLLPLDFPFFILSLTTIFYLDMGSFSHVCESDMVFKSLHTKIPKFNSPVFFENKKQVGVIDESMCLRHAALPVMFATCALHEYHSHHIVLRERARLFPFHTIFYLVVFGPVNEVYFTVKPSEGIQASSFKNGDKVYIAPFQ